MKILIVSATTFEVQPTLDFLAQNKEKINVHIDFLITGIGMVATTFQLTKKLQNADYQLVINAGIAGAYSKDELKLGDVVNVVCEQFSDIGAEDKDGSFIDFFQNGLINANEFPFRNGEMLNSAGAEFDFLPLAKGLTRNTTSGFLPNIEKLKSYQADVETMEGAAFFYVCLQSEVNFLQIRAISNYVEARNRENWKMKEAIEKLNEVLTSFLTNLK
jgi:futalosine hydrolase